MNKKAEQKCKNHFTPVNPEPLFLEVDKYLEDSMKKNDENNAEWKKYTEGHPEI